MQTNRALRLQLWLPFGFAALLCAMKVLLPDDAGAPAFFCFLPMCFLFAAQTQLALARRVAALESAAAAPAPVPRP